MKKLATTLTAAILVGASLAACESGPVRTRADIFAIKDAAPHAVEDARRAGEKAGMNGPSEDCPGEADAYTQSVQVKLPNFAGQDNAENRASWLRKDVREAFERGCRWMSSRR